VQRGTIACRVHHERDFGGGIIAEFEYVVQRRLEAPRRPQFEAVDDLGAEIALQCVRGPA
jgi:hypothetical protein